MNEDSCVKPQAVKLRNDLILFLKHLPTLPLLIGTPLWWIRKRYTLNRPYSELNLALYPFEMFRITVQCLVSFFPTVLIICALAVALTLEHFSEYLSIPYLSLPFQILVRAIPRLYTRGTLRFSSPIDIIASQHGALTGTDQRRVLYPSHTNVAVSGRGEEVWYYVNGVAEQGAMVQATCVLLRRLTGRMVNPFINLSHGIPLDLLECLIGRSLGIASATALELIPRVIDELACGRRVVLVGHSQGGIILANVVRRLVELADSFNFDSKICPIKGRSALYNTHTGRSISLDYEKIWKAVAVDGGLKRLEVYTFAGACDEFHESKRGGPFAEHFATELDFVSRFGVLTFSGKLEGTANAEWNGAVYMLPRHTKGQGHLMVRGFNFNLPLSTLLIGIQKEMILPALTNKLFGSTSRFWKNYCSTTEGEENKIKYHIVEINEKEEG